MPLVVIVLVGLILDMMIEKKKIFLLEINTQPGLTSNSLLPEMAKEKISFFELCEILINNPTCEKY